MSTTLSDVPLIGDDPSDLVIVGAGPVGLYATYYAGFRGLRVILVDSSPQVGGQIMTMYPEKVIYDVAGFAGIRGADLVRGLLDQAGRYKYDLLLSESVNELEQTKEGDYCLVTNAGRQIRTRAVLIAAGLGLSTPKTLDVGRESMPDGVLSFVPQLSILNNQDVIIAGGGDSAVDWALAAITRAKSVTVIHRRPRFRAHEAGVEEMRLAGVRIIAPGEVREIRGLSKVESAVVEFDGERLTLPCDKFIMALGFSSSLGPLESWGLNISGFRIPVLPSMQTSRTRIFAAGDISEYPGKVRLISVGFGEAAIAVNHAATAIRPDLQLFPGHSTHGVA